MLSSRFTAIYLFNDREAATPVALSEKLESVVTQKIPEVRFNKPGMPHVVSPTATADQSLQWLSKNFLPSLLQNSLIVGIGLGGLLAAKLQEMLPQKKASVLAINAPLFDCNVSLSAVRLPDRVSLYSSLYEPIRDRCLLWPQVAEAYDVAWLQHHLTYAKFATGHLVAEYIKDEAIANDVAAISCTKPNYLTAQ